ncbi:MAG: biliverdin-producing heme oxygenase [Bdellovibrionota bacterium]
MESAETLAPKLPDLISELRSVTRESHSKIENILKDLTDPSLTRERYAEILSGFHTFNSLIEPSLSKFERELSALGIEISDRKKSGWLHEDLALVSVEARSKSIDISSVKPPNSVPEALGWLYVLEGSTLGGQVIAKNLSAALGIEADSGARYFSAYGSQTGKMWQSFLRSLNRYELEMPKGVSSSICAAAVGAFESLALIFRR